MTRNVGDLPPDERKVYERVLGQHLENNQRLFVQISVIDVEPPTANDRRLPTSDEAPLPESYSIFKDLSDAEVAALESVILDRSDSRPS